MSALKFIFSICTFIFVVSGANAERILHDMYGQTLSFSALKGKWVFINYWASWCHTCIDEIPELNHFYEENKNNVALFAVNYDALSLKMQQRLIQKYGIRYPSLGQDPAESLQLGDIRGVPVTFVFNPQGQLVNALYGGQTAYSLREAYTEK